MAYKTYKQLCDYFEALPTSVTALKSAIAGEDEGTIDAQNSSIRYPHLRVETPTLRFRNEDETMVTRYTFRMFVLSNRKITTNAQANQLLSDMEALARAVIKQMWQDADAGNFDLITGDNEGDAVRAWSADDLFGWWWTAVVELWTDECA